MSELPKGWTTTNLNELFEFKYGRGLVQEKRNPAGSVNVYGSNGIVGKHDEALTDGTTIIVGRKGSVGEVNFSTDKCWAIDTTYYVDDFAGELPPNYWAWYLKSLRLGQQEKSSAIPGISRDDIYGIDVLLPPLNEQRRIVAKLEQLLSLVDAAQARLATITRTLKQFRRSVLASACSGRLTEDWRVEHPGAEPYTPPTLPSADVGLRDENYPNNWRVTRLGTLTALVTSGSRGWAKYYSDSGSIFIRAQNINADILNLEDIAFVTLPGGAEGLRTRVRQGDLLVTITGANVTKSALVERPIGEAFVSQHVALVRLADLRLSKFLFYSIINPSDGRKQLQTAAYGQGKPGLNLDNIRDVVVAIPPLAEQQEIVRRVEALFKTAAALEGRYRTAKAHVDKLTQSILAKAFRGELVPQGPNDEPASILLERIRKVRGLGDEKSEP